DPAPFRRCCLGSNGRPVIAARASHDLPRDTSVQASWPRCPGRRRGGAGLVSWAGDGNRCHADSVPRVASLEELHQAIGEVAVGDLGLVTEPAALAAGRQSLDSAGLLLLGETHGVRENPLLIRALMQAFRLTSLALEWDECLASIIKAFLASGTLADHRWL